MIRINLLKQLSQAPAAKAARKSIKFPVKPLLIAACLIIALIGGLILYNKLRPFEKEESSVELASQTQSTIPQKPEYRPKVVISHAVEEIVKEIEGEHRILPRYSGYSDLNPAQKIEHQLSVCKKTLNYLKQVTSGEIGYTDLILTTPGDLYLHGMAPSNEYYERFKKNLASASFIKIKPGIIKPIGEQNLAREFSFYGTLSFRPPSPSGTKVVKANEIPGMLSRIKEIGNASGLKLSSLTLKSMSNVGMYKRHIYRTQAPDCSFSQFQNFVTKLQVTKSKAGILKFALKAEGDEVLNASLEMVMYTN